MRGGVVLVDERHRTMLVDERSRVSCSLTSKSRDAALWSLLHLWWMSPKPGWWLLIAVPFLCMRIVTLSLLLPGFVLKPRDLISELHIIRCPRIW